MELLDAARQSARDLLKKHRVVSPPVDVEKIAFDEELEVVYYDLEDEVSGLLVQKSDRPVLAVNATHHENRQRFTIAHELGHYRLHRDQPTVFVDDMLVHFRHDAGRKPSDPLETQANEFAACLLMPERFLRRDLKDGPVEVEDEGGVQRLARRYRVSTQALVIRLTRLGFGAG